MYSLTEAFGSAWHPAKAAEIANKVNVRRDIPESS
jgi:hypothetical protein